MRRGPLALLALACASCGLVGGDPLADAADSLGDIRSGVLAFRLVAESEGGQEAGFFLRGAFSLPEGEELPVADLTYGRLGIEGEPRTSFVSTGDAAYLTVDGTAYELPPESVGDLVGSAAPGDEGPFDQLEMTEWVDDPEESEGRPLGEDGVPTTVVSGELDVVTALNDLFDLARGNGFDLPPLEGDEAERLREAVEDARLEVVTADGVFRRLTVTVDLGSDAPQALQEPLAELLGVRFQLHVAIDEPNEPVTVEPPSDPQPIEDLAPGLD